MGLSLAGNVQRLRRRSILGQAVVVLLMLELFWVGSFVSAPLPTATATNLANYLHNRALCVLPYLPARLQEEARERIPDLSEPQRPVRYSLYTAQAPLAVFAGYVLGWQLGTIAAALFFVLGLAGPAFGLYLFAGGGGPAYYLSPGFGYLIGMVAASFTAGWVTVKRRTSFRQILAVLGGLLAVHLIGLAYMTASYLVTGLLEGELPQPEWHAWVGEEARNLTWYPLPYDLIFSFALVGVGFPFRALVSTMTAPDIALRPKSQPKFEDVLSE